MASKVKITISIDEAFVRELEGASRRGQQSRSRLDDKEFKKGRPWQERITAPPEGYVRICWELMN